MKYFLTELMNTFIGLLAVALPCIAVTYFFANSLPLWAICVALTLTVFTVSLIITLIDKATNNTIGRWGL